MIHNKFRYLLTLVALFAMTAGAWAQATFGVKEITADMVPADWNNDNTIVTPEDLAALGITFFGVTKAQASAWADYPKVGTVRLLYAYSSGFSSIDWSDGTPDGDSWNFTRKQIYNANATGYRYFVTVPPAAPSGPEVTWNATTKQATFEMPAYDVELIPEYYPGMLTFGSGAIEGGTLSVVGMGLGTTSFTVPSEWNHNITRLTSSHFEGFKSVTEEEAKAWPGVPATGLVALYYNYDETEQKWDLIYFKDGAFYEIYKGRVQQLTSIYNLPKFNFSVFYTTGMQMPEGFEKDEEGNIYVKAGTEFKVKAVPAEGYRLMSLMFGETDVTDKVDADGIATVTMPDEYADLTLIATFSNEYNVALNAEGLSDEEAAAWKAATGDNAPAALPLENVKYGTEVKVTYTGTKKVIGVKAEKKGAAPAEGKTYTNLNGGEVLHVGDKFIETEGLFRSTHDQNPTESDYYTYLRSGITYEVLRADVVKVGSDYEYTESPNGQYYVLKCTYYDYDDTMDLVTEYNFIQNLPVTGTSDGIKVTLDGQDGSQQNLYTFWVHEPNQ